MPFREGPALEPTGTEIARVLNRKKSNACKNNMVDVLKPVPDGKLNIELLTR